LQEYPKKENMMKPNILIFITDQQRGDVIHPDHPCITPNIDRFREEGVFFTNAYTPTAHCCPSRATLMTGLYPSRHGVFNNVSTPTAINRELAENTVMFSELLRDDGYKLVYTGKWHVSDTENPEDRGWEEMTITARAGTYMHCSIPEWQNMEIEETKERKHGEVLRPGWGNFQLFETRPDSSDSGYGDHPDYRFIKDAKDALPRLADGDEPWALYVGLNAPHDPFRVPQKFLDMYDLEDIPLPPTYNDDLADKPRVYQRMRRQYWGQLSEEEIRDAIRHYWAYCTMVDTMFGEVLEALEQTGQADNTLVLFTSDHGEYCGDHGIFMKGVPAFKQAYNVPAIMRLPSSNSPNQIDEFISVADFMPTFLDVARVPIPENLTGRSLLPFLEGTIPEDWRDAHYTQFNGVELYYSQRSVTTKDYKYVYNGFDDDEFYDLRNDPHELKNVAHDPVYTEAKRELVRKMWRFAAQEKDDRLFNPYGTVALAPWGPADAFNHD
jgi:arylsulfatase A-like enzyme